MHIEDTTNIIEIHPPGRKEPFVALCVKKLAGIRLCTSLDDVRLDYGQSPMIERLVSESLGAYVAGSTHVFNRSIASRIAG